MGADVDCVLEETRWVLSEDTTRVGKQTRFCFCKYKRGTGWRFEYRRHAERVDRRRKYEDLHPNDGQTRRFQLYTPNRAENDSRVARRDKKRQHNWSDLFSQNVET